MASGHQRPSSVDATNDPGMQALCMCVSSHLQWIIHTSLTIETEVQEAMNPASDKALRVVEAAFEDDGYVDTAISAALMRQVARGEMPPTARLHRTGPILAFGRLDRLRPGYGRAVEIAREHGYLPVERLAGGRAAVFHEGTISFSTATRAPE